MIEAYFQTSEDEIIPAYLPTKEIIEIAELAGMAASDLFSIEIPAGASRESRIKCLVPSHVIGTLYASANDGTASAAFKWRSSSNDTQQQMTVYLLPPKPVFMNDGGYGVHLVEAVDARHWWRHAQLNSLNTSMVFGDLFSSDGRWKTVTGSGASCLELLQTLIAFLPVGTISTAGYTPAAALVNRFADHVFTPEMSVALAIDIVLSQSGYVLLWKNGSTPPYIVKQIQDDTSLIGAWMTSHKVASAAGLEQSSGTAASTEPLMSQWNADANLQYNRMPSKASVSHPFRTVEGKTYYDNNPTVSGAELRFATHREYGMEQTVATAQTRRPTGALVLKEPRSLVAGATPQPFTPATPLSNTTNSPTPPAWDYIAYRTEVMNLLKRRCEMSIGTVVWGGWPILPDGAFRGSMMRFSCGYKANELVPITVTVADDSDWIFGPNGEQPNDPNDIVISKGLIHARRLGSGVLQIDAAPPMCRVFPAVIVNATRIDTAGDEYWQWQYQFEEVEPNTSAVTPMTVSLSFRARTGNSARNLTEDGNEYYGAGNIANVVAPGIRQSDYPSTTIIDALPIKNGTVVQMVEQFPTSATSGSPPYVRQYWFAMPNAVRVSCTSPFTGDTDYGSFAFPTAEVGQYGTFDAPEGTADYGAF